MFTTEQIRKAQELAVIEMKKSISEPDGKIHPLVGAVLLFPDGHMESAYRGELDYGDHGEFTLLHKKQRDISVKEALFFSTLEPCMKRKPPKLPCAERIHLRQIKKVYVGIVDPDPTVSGKGIQYLLDNGISIEYFDRDLQQEISLANSEFLDDAVMRAEVYKHDELLKSSNGEEHVLDSIVQNASDKDVSLNAIKEFVRLGNKALKKREKSQYLTDENVWDYFIQWGLIKVVSGKRLYSRNFALLFFKSPNSFLNNSLFNVRSNVTLRGVMGFDEPLLLLADKILDWIKINTPTNSFRESAVRTDAQSYGYPDDIILEAIINAMIHRDYSIAGAFNQATIENHGIIIKSVGSPILPQTLKDLSTFNASTIIRNHKLAFIFRFINQMDNNNVGMAKFKALPLREHLPFPVYEFKSPNLITFFFKDFSEYAQHATEKYDSSLSEEEVIVLELAKTYGKTTMKDIKNILRLSNDKASQRLLTGLVTKGQLVTTGSNKNRAYKCR